jgi:hypothetical protein
MPGQPKYRSEITDESFEMVTALGWGLGWGSWSKGMTVLEVSLSCYPSTLSMTFLPNCKRPSVGILLGLGLYRRDTNFLAYFMLLFHWLEVTAYCVYSQHFR